MKNRAYIVLGMHRSGTSALAGSLESAGLFLGDVNSFSEDNRKGNRESLRVMTLHDDLLHRNGGAWNNPVSNLTWDPIHRSMRDLIIDSFSEKAAWGFKDPRTLFTLNGWLKALPDAQLVGIYRHPYFVAESLFIRNGIPHETGLALWVSYNRVLLWYYNNVRKFPIVEFSEDEDIFLNQLFVVSKAIGLSDRVDEFFEPSLRQQTIPQITGCQSAVAATKLFDKLRASSFSTETQFLDSA